MNKYYLIIEETISFDKHGNRELLDINKRLENLILDDIAIYDTLDLNIAYEIDSNSQHIPFNNNVVNITKIKKFIHNISLEEHDKYLSSIKKKNF